MTNRMNVVNAARKVQEAELYLEEAKRDVATCEKGLEIARHQSVVNVGTDGEPTATTRWWEDETARYERDLVTYKDALRSAQISYDHAMDDFNRTREKYMTEDTSDPHFWL